MPTSRNTGLVEHRRPLALLQLICLIITVGMAHAWAQPLTIYTEELPPLQLVKNGEVQTGYAYELLMAVLKEADLNANLLVYPWPRAMKLTRQNRNAFILSMIRSPEREANYIWVIKLLSLKPQLVKLRTNTEVQVVTIDDVSYYKVGAIRGDYGEEFLRSIGLSEKKENLYLAVKYDNMWKMLFNHRLDMVFANPLTAKQESLKAGLPANSLQAVMDIQGIQSDLYLGANLETDPQLVNKIRQAYKKLLADGTLPRIKTYWLQKLSLQTN